jgi:EF-P beta-lysylation protein EpmB
MPWFMNPGAALPQSSITADGLSAVGQPWQRDLSRAIRTSAELFKRLELQPEQVAGGLADEELQGFPVLVPESFLARMRPGDPSDPLLLQVLPRQEERETVDGFVTDAVGDLQARRAPGILQKYHGRVLMIAAGACAVHCRYCFRRDYPYSAEPHRLDDWELSLRAIEGDGDVQEVILSGGDPLMLNDQRLEQLCRRIEQIPQIERVRIHTRLPIVLPSRVTESLTGLLTGLRPQVVMVVHANHPAEIQGDCRDALRRLVAAGLPVLNQAVLLRGVNDSLSALEGLSRSLINVGVMPYYLHQLDRVAGTAHFEVSEELGRRLITELQARLPGYAVPKYVREIAGDTGKTPVFSGW